MGQVACACVEKPTEDKAPKNRPDTEAPPCRSKTLELRQARARTALGLALAGDDAQAIANAIAQCTVADIPESELIVAERALLDASVKWKELEGSFTARQEGIENVRRQRQDLDGDAMPEDEDYRLLPTPRGCTDQEKEAFRLEHVLKRCNLQELSDAVVSAEIAGLSRGTKNQQALIVRGRQTLKKLQAKRAAQQSRWARESLEEKGGFSQRMLADRNGSIREIDDDRMSQWSARSNGVSPRDPGSYQDRRLSGARPPLAPLAIKDAQVCRQCGAATIGSKFCGECGAPRQAPGAQPQNAWGTPRSTPRGTPRITPREDVRSGSKQDEFHDCSDENDREAEQRERARERARRSRLRNSGASPR